jgi:5-methylcytosine-specific restriction protein A
MKNPTWTRDEIILAMDFYMDHFESIPGKESSEINDLSKLLNKFRNKNGLHGDAKFRNNSGVYMKMMNLRGFDDRYTGSGLKASSKGDREVWDHFFDKPEELKKAANKIREYIESENVKINIDIDIDIDSEFEEEASEGKIITRIHQTYERDTKLVRMKKERVLKEKGKLLCEACGFDFSDKYGERGKDFIECHHTKPVSEIGDKGKTNIDELALLCANCHRMIHRKRPWLSVSVLKNIICEEL